MVVLYHDLWMISVYTVDHLLMIRFFRGENERRVRRGRPDIPIVEKGWGVFIDGLAHVLMMIANAPEHLSLLMIQGSHGTRMEFRAFGNVVWIPSSQA